MGHLWRPFLLFFMGFFDKCFLLAFFRFGWYLFIEWYEMWYECPWH